MRTPYFISQKDVAQNKKTANATMGKRIRELRKSKNDTQRELAQYLELGKKKSENSGKQIISYAERGIRSLPANIIPLIADKYNTSVESFFTEDKIYFMSENIFYELISNLDTTEENRVLAMKYMNYLKDSAIKSVGTEKLFDILFTVMREASFGNTNGMSIGADIDTINKVHQQNESHSMYLENVVKYSKEMMSNSNFIGLYGDN